MKYHHSPYASNTQSVYSSKTNDANNTARLRSRDDGDKDGNGLSCGG